jgi:hypothetical protein
LFIFFQFITTLFSIIILSGCDCIVDVLAGGSQFEVV